MIKNRLSIILLIIAVMAFNLVDTAYSATLTLVKDKKPSATIVVGKRISKVEKYAAHELQKYLKKISGALIPIKTEGEKIYGNRIILGTMESNGSIKKMTVQLKRIKTLGQEGFIIKTMNNDLIIAGGGNSGVLYGVYTFLEKYLGCRWYLPGKEGEIVPKNETVSLSQIEDIQMPSFECRGIIINEVQGHQYNQDIIDWMARNKINIKPTHHHVLNLNKMLGYKKNSNSIQTQYEGMLNRAIRPESLMHSFWWLVPANDYYDKHPEYYSLIKGERKRPVGGGVNVQLCLSNPDVQKISIEKTKAFFTKYPALKIIGVSPNDNHIGVGWCECEKCKAMGKFETDRVVRFVNIVAKELAKSHPGKYIGFLAYSECTRPSTVKPYENVVVQYVKNGRCYKHTLNDPTCKANYERMKEINGWLKKVKADHFSWADYTLFTKDLSLGAADVVAKDLKWMHKRGISGYFDVVTPFSWGMFKLNHYVLAKMSWDVTLKYEDILDDFCQNYYGKAGNVMKKYYLALDKGIKKAKGCFSRGNPANVEKILSADLVRRLKGYLTEAKRLSAENKAANTKVRKETGLYKRYLMESIGRSDIDKEETKNIIQNPGFEQGQKKWSNQVQRGKYTIVIDETEAQKGGKSIKIMGSETGRARVLQYVPVEKGKKYYFSAWVKAEQNSHFYLYLSQGTSHKQGKIVHKLIDLNGAKKAKWEKYIIPEITIIDSELGLFLMNDGTGSVWFDDIVLRKIKE